MSLLQKNSDLNYLIIYSRISYTYQEKTALYNEMQTTVQTHFKTMQLKITPVKMHHNTPIPYSIGSFGN